ncbi:hypothetical protein KBX50_28525 [Micromonospora sp. C51]|uniref:hypothetical protein n=1 Tax=Micromonospora sp. C51 TaxID=2824879 RepID=UPI001B389B04|nr:hypothetical protein [Micromonospora sp. C51]MBQ1052384.1 hypothetical protein [Micromonospora sp. C51]
MVSEAWEKFYGPDFPPVRSPPSELKVPDSAPVSNLAMLMLPAPTIGNDVVEVLGLYLAADARMNVWYARGAGKSKPTGRELAEIRSFSMEILWRVYEAWKRLEDVARMDDREDFDESYRALLGTLRQAVSEVCSRMGESLADLGSPWRID